jgi:dihydroxyacetone kinase-like predicted kinase
MNPSVEDLLHAAQRANAKSVLLLPNNGNIVMAANHAAELAEFPVKVVPTRTIPQGIGAALSFNFEKDLAHNAEAMLAAARRIVTGEITTSTRTVTVNGVSVADGQVIGLIDDKLAVAGADVRSTTLALLEKAEARKHELITLYFGNGMGETEAGAIADQVRAAFPDQIVELFAGRQPHYDFVIGIE